MTEKNLETTTCKKDGFIDLAYCKRQCPKNYKTCEEYEVRTHIFGSMILNARGDFDKRMKPIYGGDY